MKWIVIVLHWAVWLSLVFVHYLGFVSMKGDTSYFRLTPGDSTEISLFRLYPTPLHFELHFDKLVGQLRPELGSPRYVSHENVMRFDIPGEAIKILVNDGETGEIYEQIPYGSSPREKEQSIAIRMLVPYVEHNDRKEFRWPPANELRLQLKAGFSKLKISCIEAGPLTTNEQVTLFVEPPINPKTVHTLNYMWLGWLMLVWPFTGLGLLLYAGLLLHKTIKGVWTPERRSALQSKAD